MKKAFVINGGAGRVLCAIPALEHYVNSVDKDVVIIVEGWIEVFLSSPLLMDKVYPASHKDLMLLLQDREVITPEPYRLNAYFTQKANLVQAFDMLINYDVPPTEIPATKQFDFSVGKGDQAFGYNLVAQAGQALGKEKIVVIQPFGSSAKQEGVFIIDESGRSMEVAHLVTLVEKLSKDYGVILMTQVKPHTDKQLGAIIPENVNLLQWMGVIHAADYFIGCDSVGQHIANALGKPATVVIGATFPENISYSGNKQFTILDKGKGKRKYSPIRITHDITIERNNEALMMLTKEDINSIVVSVDKALTKGKK